MRKEPVKLSVWAIAVGALLGGVVGSLLYLWGFSISLIGPLAGLGAFVAIMLQNLMDKN